MSYRLIRLAMAVCLVAALLSPPALAQQTGSQAAAAGQPRIEVCKLLPKAEVKKYLPWMDALDQMPIEEEAVGAGSSCNYPTVHVQVLQFSQGFIDAVRKSGPLEPISGVGDEAYLRNNKNRYAELVVKVGTRLLTLQADIDDSIETIKPKVIELAKAYVAKLR